MENIKRNYVIPKLITHGPLKELTHGHGNGGDNKPANSCDGNSGNAGNYGNGNHGFCS